VEIFFKDRKLKKLFDDPKELYRAYVILTRKIDQRKEELKAADTLEDIRKIIAARCHELEGNWKGYLAVNVSVNYRLIFKPEHDPLPFKEDGGLDWQQVTAIRIVKIEDYH